MTVQVKLKTNTLKPFVYYHQLQRPVEWNALFANENPIDVEIGFGNGEFLVRMAQQYPLRNFIGVEQHWERIKRTLNRIAACDLHNIRILFVDARVVLERLIRPQSIDNVYCLFPCPWPKKNHAKHRLFSKYFLTLVNSRLSEKGTLQIVTDYDPYRDWILQQSENTGFGVKISTIKPQYGTKFERKWLAQGQQAFFELIFQKEAHIDIPIKEDTVLEAYYADTFNPDTFKMIEEKGSVSIIFKDLIYDDKKKKAMILLVIAEEGISQQLWVNIRFQEKWAIFPAPGQRFLPTPGVQQALKLVFESCQRG